MAPTKLVNLFAIASLAILACSFGPAPANALSVVPHNARSRSHALLARNVNTTKRRRGQRCKPRPAGSSASPPPKQSTTAPPAPPKGSTTAKPSPASTSKPAPSSTPVNSGSTGGSGKVGIAWALGDDPALANFKRGNVGPLYTWSPFIPDQARKLGFNPIPMLWGDKQIDDFKRLVVKGYATTVLGFNEPNQAGQAQMSPEHGAQLWRDYIQPLKDQGYSLISPATTSAPSGKDWMQQFFAACSGCHFDGIAIHWYGTDPQALIEYIQDFAATFKNMPIWVTEFACQNFSGGAQCTKDQTFNFMSVAKNFMDNSPLVKYYFAFGVMHDMSGVNSLDQLMAANGQPTDLGNLYLGS